MGVPDLDPGARERRPWNAGNMVGAKREAVPCRDALAALAVVGVADPRRQAQPVGDVVRGVGEAGMIFTLPAGKSEITQDTLM